MTAPIETVHITPEDRLGFTLCLAIIVHAMVILGVSFTPPDFSPRGLDSIEVILVQESSDKAPDKADYLAQANLEGGGDDEKAERPATPLVAPFPDKRAEIVAAPVPEEPAQTSKEAPERKESKELAVEAEVAEQPKPEPKPSPKPVAEAKPAKPAVPTEAPPPSAATLISNSFETASLNAEIQQRLEARAKRPRRKFISASTREYKFAAYMEAWRAKVERIGNLNYPEEARSRQISGNLILDVALKPDGSVAEVAVRQPSGYKMLDEAAIRIVHLAAPYAPFPSDIRKDVDVLHITRTWQFLNSNRFISK